MALGGRPFRLGADPYCEEKEVDGRGGAAKVPPSAAKADVVGRTLFEVLTLASRLANMLGGIVSLIFREGSFGIATGAAFEEEAMGWAGVMVELGLVAEVV
jgi:hypothetical protein